MNEEVDYKELYLRALADYDNLKKRNVSISEDSELKGKIEIIREVISPLSDSLSSAKMNNILDGMNNSLKRLGVGVIDKEFEGKDFDPDFMECLMTVPTDDESLRSKVVKIDRVGYVDSKGKVIVPAMVSVYLK